MTVTRLLRLFMALGRIGAVWFLCLVIGATAFWEGSGAGSDVAAVGIFIASLAIGVGADVLWRRRAKRKQGKTGEHEARQSKKDKRDKAQRSKATRDKQDEAVAVPLEKGRQHTAVAVGLNIVVFLLAYGSCALLFGVPTELNGWLVYGLAAVMAVAIRVFVARKSRRKSRLRSQQEATLLAKVGAHHAPLRRNLTQAVRKNDYGAVVQDNRAAVVQEFLRSVAIDIDLISHDDRLQVVLREVEALDAAQQATTGFDPDSLPTDGLAFEAWVAESLHRFGWKAEATVGSGDQGLDVVAEKHGVKVGIQCKLYSSNVGNKAVQEIIAAQQYFSLDAKVVLSNAGFTRSARDLAESCDVHLLSPHDIPSFDRLFLFAGTRK